MPKTEALEPWQWPEQHWRKLINRIRAGRALRPTSWPHGARCAVAFSFDSDHETNELRDGGKSIGRMSWGQYGNRVGVPRILALLAKHGVPATFYVPAVAALTYPDEQRRIVAEAHEIGIHGWIHELNSVLPYEVERDLMCALPRRWRRSRAYARLGSAPRPGTSAPVRWRSRRRWGCSMTAR